MSNGQIRDPRTVPHEGDLERESRQQLTKLLTDTPIPPEYLIDNLAVYMRRFQLSDLLSLDVLYRMLPDLPGVIMEFGVLHGRHLAAMTALRHVYEPYNSLRRIIGFDTFEGLTGITDIDRASPSAVEGRFAVPPDEVGHLRQVLAAHEAGEPYGHTQRSFIVQGDVRETVPAYLAEHPETVLAMAYFDLDLYEPTRDVLRAIRPHLTKGSIVAFDELTHPRWPGETAALDEVFGLGKVTLRQVPVPGREPPIIYFRYGG